jgi:hypothetical protein
VLSSRLTATIAAALLLLTACAGADGTERGAIRENVIEPGITAIEESRTSTCGVNASTLRTAMDAYEALVGSPAPDEAALVGQGLLRQETTDWNVVDGRLVAENPACGDVPTTVPAEDIVTEAESAATPTVDDVLATFTQDEVVSLGGPECARELAVVFAATSRFVAERGADPESFADLEAAGMFAEPVELWEVVDDILRPTNGSPCSDFVAEQQVEEQARFCRIEARTLEVAREAYLAAAPGRAEPTQQDLLDDGMIREQAPDLTLLNGVITPTVGGPCEGIDLFPPSEPADVTAGD